MAKSSFLSFAPTTSSSAKEIVVRKNAKNLTNPSDEHYYTQQEIESHSITPDTFRDRTLHQFKYLSEDFTWFIDEYEHGQSAVKRYGINAAKIKLDPDDKAHWPQYAQASATKPTTSDDILSNLSGPKLETSSKNVIHEPLETCLVEKAVDYLLDPSTKSKTVLVDIFARHTAKCIKLETNSKGQTVLETHTVVLFKSLSANGKYDILIIDPNNFAYSSHITNMKPSLSNGANFNGFSALHSKEMQIYKDAGKKGPKPDEYRDCTDVAVKLAFSLNASPEKSINIKKIKDLEEIKRISNQDEIDKFIFLTPAKVLPSDPKNSIATIRIKQSSNVIESEVYYKFEQMMDGGNKLLKATGKHPDEILKYLRPKFLTIISTQEEYSVTLKSLLDFALEYKKHVADECLDTCEKIFEDIPNLLGHINP